MYLTKILILLNYLDLPLINKVIMPWLLIFTRKVSNAW